MASNRIGMRPRYRQLEIVARHSFVNDFLREDLSQRKERNIRDLRQAG